jgi:hypothetical protein
MARGFENRQPVTGWVQGAVPKKDETYKLMQKWFGRKGSFTP